MNKEGPEYRSILGDAAQIDRDECPYLVVYVTDKEVVASSCVQTDQSLLQMANTAVGLLGDRIAHTRQGELPVNGLTSKENQIMLGLASIFIGFMSSASEEGKKSMAHIAATTIDQFLIKQHDLAQAYSDVKGEPK